MVEGTGVKYCPCLCFTIADSQPVNWSFLRTVSELRLLVCNVCKLHIFVSAVHIIQLLEFHAYVLLEYCSFLSN